MDFDQLMKPYIISFNFNCNSIPVFNYAVDWKKLAIDYDGIEVYAGSSEILKSLFYGWECDSICIFHEEAIVLLNDK